MEARVNTARLNCSERQGNLKREPPAVAMCRHSFRRGSEMTTFSERMVATVSRIGLDTALFLLLVYMYIMDLANGTYAKAEANSEESESWHSWSSNSRWIAFSSKRGGGLLTRCYISYVDETARTRKPFLLPQSDPEFYESSLKMVSLPELVTAPVTASRATLQRAVRSAGARHVETYEANH